MATGFKQLLISPDGGTFTLGNGDASLEFPPGAVEKNIHIRYAIILHGPFVFPASFKPVSVVVYINMDGATLVKPVQLFLSHWCIREETDDEETMKFVRAPHSLESEKKEYAFEEVEEEADFTTRTNVGVLTIQEPHCLYCVKSKLEKEARYCAMKFTRYDSSEETLLFRIQLSCDSLDWVQVGRNNYIWLSMYMMFNTSVPQSFVIGIGQCIGSKGLAAQECQQRYYASILLFC